MGANVAARVADCDARLPGRAVADRQKSAAAKRQRAPADSAHGRVRNARRPHQLGGHRPDDLEALVRGIGRAAVGPRAWLRLRPRTRDQPCARECGHRGSLQNAQHRTVDGRAAEGWRAVRADPPHRPGVCRPAGAPPGHRAADASSGAGRHLARGPADAAVAAPDRTRRSSRRRIKATIPTRSCKGWDTAPQRIQALRAAHVV